ncbi:uncharacterized protein [Haliotis asinina]|uniref:uncharacterized protein n=1 Tax=Haliotis asinina TaxID=109174 RepID=UPI003531E3B3
MEFVWPHEHQESFTKLKKLCSSPPVLTYYNVKRPVEIQCVRVQEQRCAQIEKEMLLIVHATTKFHCYIFGKETTVYNDHKPLEDICKKPLMSAPMRLQRVLLKVQKYDLIIKNRKGKDMTVADALSRAYLQTSESEIDGLERINMIDIISVSPDRYAEIQKCTAEELPTLRDYILNGWPDNPKDITPDVKPYWNCRDQLAVSDSVIYKGLRLFIPPSLSKHMLTLIDKSHLGMVKCKQRACEVMFWPGINTDIKNTIRDCQQVRSISEQTTKWAFAAYITS